MVKRYNSIKPCSAFDAILKKLFEKCVMGISGESDI